MRQAGQQGAANLLGLRAADSTHHADTRLASCHARRVEAAHVCTADTANTGLGQFIAVGVVTIHRLRISAPRQRAWPGVRFFDGSDSFLLVALPQRVRKCRLTDLPGRQRNSLGQQVGFSQGAQIKAKAISACTGTKLRTQIRPGFAQSIFVQRRLCSLCKHPFFKQRSGHAGQASLAGRVVSAARVKVNLHVKHGDRWAFNKKHSRAVWEGQLLYR